MLIGKSADEMCLINQQNPGLFDQLIAEARCKLWTVKVSRGNFTRLGELAAHHRSGIEVFDRSRLRLSEFPQTSFSFCAEQFGAHAEQAKIWGIDFIHQ